MFSMFSKKYSISVRCSEADRHIMQQKMSAVLVNSSVSAVLKSGQLPVVSWLIRLTVQCVL